MQSRRRKNRRPACIERNAVAATRAHNAAVAAVQMPACLSSRHSSTLAHSIVESGRAMANRHKDDFHRRRGDQSSSAERDCAFECYNYAAQARLPRGYRVGLSASCGPTTPIAEPGAECYPRVAFLRPEFPACPGSLRAMPSLHR